jgi:hypothetical protein
MVIGEPAQRLPRLGGIAVDFSAVARGDDRGFLDRVAIDQVAQRLHQIFGAEHHLFAQRKRRGLVVDAESEKLHESQAAE